MIRDKHFLPAVALVVLSTAMSSSWALAQSVASVNATPEAALPRPPFAASRVRVSSWVTTVRLEGAPSRVAQPPAPASGETTFSGIASYYWQDQMTANGERFDKSAMTAAHKTLPFGTRVKVTEARSGRSVIVRINDRGPFKPGRVIDLSQAAAEQLGMTGRGLTPVKLEVVSAR